MERVEHDDARISPIYEQRGIAFGGASRKEMPELRWKARGSGARKIVQADSGLVKIHYSDLRILFPVGEGIPMRSRTVEAPVAFLSLGPRYHHSTGGARP